MLGATLPKQPFLGGWRAQHDTCTIYSSAPHVNGTLGDYLPVQTLSSLVVFVLCLSLIGHTHCVAMLSIGVLSLEGQILAQNLRGTSSYRAVSGAKAHLIPGLHRFFYHARPPSRA